ncbi:MULTISPECIES: PucR family transcriptional regulator [unclassified Jeotgalibaca]|uniref:PucR family transcriptional regulator n=1 Tax=unclassified Jeotgalibaca TaxID=2621505 RepID=UPI003FD222D7
MNLVPVTIKETLEQTFFKNGFKVVAGKSGINNLIQSVSVMEVVDFVKFDLGKDLLILTTFSFCEKGGEGTVAIFRALAEKGISAIVVKLNRFVEKLPDEFFDIGNEFGIPVIICDSTIPFREIINEVSKKIINSQLDTIVSMNQMYKNLYRSLISNHTTEKFIESLQISDEIHFYVKLEGSIVYDSKSNTKIEISEMTKKIERIDTSTQASSESYDDYYEVQKEDRVLLVYPIGGANHTFGKIIVDTKDVCITSLIKIAFTQMASYLTIKLTEHRLSQEEKINNNSRIYNDLLDNTNFSNQRALNLLHLGGFGNYSAYHLIYVSIDISSYSSFEVLKNTYTSIFYEEAPNHFISLHSNGFCIIYGMKNNLQTNNSDFEKFISRLKELFDSEDYPYKIGISNIFTDYSKISSAHRQAKRTTFISQKVKQYSETIFYNEIWEVDMLRNLHNSPQINNLREQVIQPLIEYDQTHQLDLIGTLAECIQTDSLKEIADNLFIHTTTLRYRLDRIDKITGYNYLTNKGKFVLTCAYFLYMLD